VSTFALHQYGSNNPLGINSSVDKIVFYPYFYVKDLVGWVAFAIFFSIFVFYAPNVLVSTNISQKGSSVGVYTIMLLPGRRLSTIHSLPMPAFISSSLSWIISLTSNRFLGFNLVNVYSGT
jgi:quinol-cytochrome oxidoreductase complex cytochrome b subunit